MVRRSKEQIARDCGLEPGATPTQAQIRQSKEQTRDLSTQPNQPPPSNRNLPALYSGSSTSKPTPRLRATPAKRQPAPALKSTSIIPKSGPSAAKSTKRIKPNVPAKNNESSITSPRFDGDDLAYLIDLIGQEENHDALFGSGSSTAIDGMTRSGAWDTLATFMNVNHNNKHHKSTAQSSDKMNLSGVDLKKRWERIKGKYNIAKGYFNETGTGKTAAEEQAGIDTLKKKQELMCPQFKSIDNIYGHKANVVPQATFETMTPKRSKPVSQPSDNNMDETIDPHLDDHQALNDHINQSQINKTPDPTPSPSVDNSPDPTPSPSVHNSPKDYHDPVLSPSTSELDRIIGGLASDGHSPLLPTHSIPSSHHSNIPPESDEPQTRSPTPLPQDKTIPSIKNAVKETKKRKACKDSIANRPMKPLPSIDENRARRKSTAAVIVSNRDEDRFNFLDRKNEAREKRESSKAEAKEARDVAKEQAETSLGEKTLDWNKLKFNSEAIAMELKEQSKVTIEAAKTDKDIAWQREKFTMENNRSVAADQARVEEQRLKTRREVMESCHSKNMSPEAIKAYLELMFSK